MAAPKINFKKKLQQAQKWFKSRWKKYDIRREIMDHLWRSTSAPYAQADKWLKEEVLPEKEYHYQQKLMTQGKLYLYNYDDPKYAKTLPFWDTQPLLISLGPIRTNEGVNDMGINLHLLPPRIRMHVMIEIFEMYKNKYKSEMFNKSQDSVNVKWSRIVKPLEKYGIGFAIRQYKPMRKAKVIEFLYQDWKNAIFIRSKGFAKTSLPELQKLWGDFVSNQNNPRLQENWLKN